MTRIIPVAPSDLLVQWRKLAPFVAKAAKRYKKDYDLEDVFEAIRSGKAMLFGIEHGGELMGAMTVAPVHQPKRKTLVIELVGGKNAKLWYSDTVRQLADTARNAGYDAITSNARHGWRKMASKVGFKETSVTYEMDLTDGTI